MNCRVGFVVVVMLFWGLGSVRAQTVGQTSASGTGGASVQGQDDPERRLAELSDDPEKAVPILLELVDHEDSRVRMAAFAKLEALGSPAARALVHELENRKDGRIDVVSCFIWLGPEARKDAVPGLMKILEDPKASKRGDLVNRAIDALWIIGPDAKDAVPLLLRALKNDNERVRLRAAETLGKIGANPAEVVPALCEVYSTIQWSGQERVIEAIGKFGSCDEKVLAVLSKGLQDESSRVREQAGIALGKVGLDCPKATELLRAALRNPDMRVRDAVIESLSKHPKAEVAAPLLVELLTQEDDIRFSAWMGLFCMGSSAVETLIAAMDDPDASMRASVTEIIYSIGPQAAAAVPELQRLLEDPVEEVRANAAMGLAGIGTASRAALEALVKALSDPSPKVQRYAAIALGAIGERSKLVDDGLVCALQTNNARVLIDVASSLAELKVTDEKALPRLVELLSMPDERDSGGVSYPGATRRSVPEMALLALKSYGSRARMAKPEVLRLAVGQAGRAVRIAALRALAEIGVTESEARQVAKLSAAEQQELDALVFHVVVRQPGVALEFLRQHSSVPSRLDPDTAAWLQGQAGEEFTALKQAVFERDDLPLEIMMQTGDPRYIAVIKQRMEKANHHRRAYLEACARALGDPPDWILRISEGHPADYERIYAEWAKRLVDSEAAKASVFSSSEGGDSDSSPSTAGETGGGDARPREWGHTDGSVAIMITGRIRMPDDSPAIAPRFYRTNDSMLLGKECRDPVDFDYDATTGRFVLRTGVFAAFSVGGGREAGPYMTGNAEVLIEAHGAKPLTVDFCDMMPDVEITLSYERTEER